MQVKQSFKAVSSDCDFDNSELSILQGSSFSLDHWLIQQLYTTGLHKFLSRVNLPLPTTPQPAASQTNNQHHCTQPDQTIEWQPTTNKQQTTINNQTTNTPLHPIRLNHWVTRQQWVLFQINILGPWHILGFCLFLLVLRKVNLILADSALESSSNEPSSSLHVENHVDCCKRDQNAHWTLLAACWAQYKLIYLLCRHRYLCG